jgi:DNA-binding transcriptional LysR family regulator
MLEFKLSTSGRRFAVAQPSEIGSSVADDGLVAGLLPELRQLRYFVAVAEDLNFTRAARRVHVVQQALSNAIAQLEQQLGAKLFVRTTRHVELTDAGNALLPHARAALTAADRGMVALADTLAGRRGRLRVGLAATAGLGLTPALLRQFRARYPDVEVETRHFDFSDPHGGLVDESMDVAIVRPPFSGSGLAMVELTRERRYAVLSSAHPLAGEPELELDQLLDEPWVYTKSDRVWSDFWRVAERRTRPSPVGPFCSGFDDLFEAARSLRGTGLVPESIAAAQSWPGLCFVPVADLPLSAVVVAWRDGDERPIVASFVDLAAELRDELDRSDTERAAAEVP